MVITTYAYDADNRRIKQTASGVVTNYLWDETSAYGDVLVETNNSNVIQTSYILGNGELISQRRNSATTPEYYLKDGQGSVRNLTDNTGSLIGGQNYTYDAFGKLTSGQTSTNSNYLYTGQQFDVLTGLYDLRARYYKPSDGRFLSRDIEGIDHHNPIELNRYGYTANNPINNFDPSGYQAIEYAQTSSVWKPLVFGAVITTAGIGVYFGNKIQALIGYLTTQFMRGFVEWFFDMAATVAQSMKPDFNRFTIAIAVAKINGQDKLFITINDCYTSVYCAIYKEINNLLRTFTDPDKFEGGYWGQPGSDGHAETKLVWLLRTTKGIESPFIPGGVSNKICRGCQNLGVIASMSPVIVRYNINDSSDLYLAAPGLE